MRDLEHPAIEKMNRCGYLGTTEHEGAIGKCDSCDTVLYPDHAAITFQDHLFCDKECLTEAFSDNPEMFGVETAEIA